MRTADMAVRAGVDWLEAGTPLIIAEGMRGVRELRARYPASAHRGRFENHGWWLAGGGSDGKSRR